MTATTFVYDVTANAFLDGRAPSELWQKTVSEALRSAPVHVVDGFALIGRQGRARFHPMGTCQSDRPDLMVAEREPLTIEKSTKNRIEYVWVVDEQADGYGINTTDHLTLRPFSPTALIEIELIAPGGARDTTCTVLTQAP